MKKILIVLCAVTLALMFSGCGEDTVSVDISQLPEIIMIKVHENYAWGRHQSITIIDRDGNCYSQSSDSNDDEKASGWVEFSDDDRYERLLEIAQNGGSGKTLPADTLGVIHQNAQYFAEWSELPIKEYETQMFDYGTVALYGVYYDAAGEPRLAMLANAGDVPHCRESASVKSFVNRTGLLDYKFT